MDNLEISGTDLEMILDRYRHSLGDGRPASYIPALGRADTAVAGLAVWSAERGLRRTGDYGFDFTIQSISKVLSLLCVLAEYDLDYVSSRVGLEPAREAFNSLLLMELKGEPRLFNPLSNPGAMVVTSLVPGRGMEKIDRLLALAEKLTGRRNPGWDEEVYLSEKATGFRNRAAVYLLKENRAIDEDPDEVVDLYFKQCSILLNCRDLARLACVVGLDGRDPETGETLLPREVCRQVRTIMATYGMYNQSGSFAVKIGLPSKSGVSGGIMAIAPRRMGIAVYNPAVNDKGNSVVGLKILEHLSRELDLSIY